MASAGSTNNHLISTATFDKFSEHLRAHKSIWELLHQNGYYTDIKDIFDVYSDEKALLDLISSIAEGNMLAWSHATAISSMTYLLCRYLKVSLIESQEAFLACLLKMVGVSKSFPDFLEKASIDAESYPVIFEYPDLIFKSQDKQIYYNQLKNALYEVPGLSLNVFKCLEYSLDGQMINEEDAKIASLSMAHKVVVCSNDLLSTFLMLPKKAQTIDALISISNSQGLYRFSTIYRAIVSLYRALPTQSERFPPGPAELEKRLSKAEDVRSELVANVRRMLTIVADMKVTQTANTSAVLAKIPYRLWLMTNSSGILSAPCISSLWEQFDKLTGKTPTDVDLDRATLAFSISHALDEVELLQWMVRQHLSAHAYAMNTYLVANKARLVAESGALFTTINRYLDYFDLAISEDDQPRPRAPTLVDAAEHDSTEDDFALFNIHNRE